MDKPHNALIYLPVTIQSTKQDPFMEHISGQDILI